MISIILPTRKRHKLLSDLLINIHSTTDLPYELIVLVDNDDIESTRIAMGNGVSVIINNPMNAVEKWNIGAKCSEYEYLFPAADDIILPKNWASIALSTPNHSGFIAIPDKLSTPDRFYEPFFLVNKAWLRRYQGGVFMVPHYKSWGVDVEICARAQESGTFTRSTSALDHNHPVFNTAEYDDTYNRAKPFWQIDVDLFHSRAEKGFPNDFNGYL